MASKQINMPAIIIFSIRMKIIIREETSKEGEENEEKENEEKETY